MNDDRTLQDQLADQGVYVETVGNILGDTGDAPIAEPCLPPRHPDQPDFPAPGIYFAMPEETYHAIHAFSTSGGKKLAASSMDYWANSTLNIEPEEDEEPDKPKAHLDLGKVYHKRIVEGADAYEASYVVGLTKKSFGDTLLTNVAQIKEAIAKAGQKPTSKGYDDLTRPAKKEDWIAQLIDIDPKAMIWDKLVADHAAANEGKTFVSARNHRRVEIAARMIEAHPELKDAFRGGWPEVSLFYFCPVTGAPVKCRMDYLKFRGITDLKSFSNQRGLPINRATEAAIASYKYNLQHVVYDEAAMAVRALIRDGIGHVEGTEEQVAWAKRWAAQPTPPVFMFVFQQTGIAPVTRGRTMPRGTVFSTTRSRARALKEKWVECARTYGVEPWLDIEPIDEVEDEAIPLYATDL